MEKWLPRWPVIKNLHANAGDARDAGWVPGLVRSQGEKVKVSQSRPTLCESMDCSLPGSSVHGILQASILEWVAVPFSRVSSYPRIKPRSSAVQADSLPSESPGKSKIPRRREW